MIKTKKIILLSIAFICLSGIMYSADFEIKPLLTNIINPFLVMADDGSIQTSKSVYEQGEQIKIIVEPNSEYVGRRMYIKEPTGGYAHFFVLPEVPARGGTYYGTIPSSAPLGTWTLVLQEVSEEGGVITGGDKFYPVNFEVVEEGEGTEHEDVGPIDPDCIPPDDVDLIDCWYREHPECPRPTDSDQPDPDEPDETYEAGQEKRVPSTPECQLFYIKKEKINKCVGTLKASSVYESDPYGRKVESMMIIPGI